MKEMSSCCDAHNVICKFKSYLKEVYNTFPAERDLPCLEKMNVNLKYLVDYKLTCNLAAESIANFILSFQEASHHGKYGRVSFKLLYEFYEASKPVIKPFRKNWKRVCRDMGHEY